MIECSEKFFSFGVLEINDGYMGWNLYYFENMIIELLV